VEEEWTPVIAVEAEAAAPPDFIPEPDVRLGIYRRLARVASVEALDELAAELSGTGSAIRCGRSAICSIWSRLRVVCRAREIAAVQAGPKGVALTPHGAIEPLAVRFRNGHVSGGHLVIRFGEPPPGDPLTSVLATLSAE
jgi:transcription-repair coupling factor (superfamily II helicase)